MHAFYDDNDLTFDPQFFVEIFSRGSFCVRENNYTKRACFPKYRPLYNIRLDSIL